MSESELSARSRHEGKDRFPTNQDTNTRVNSVHVNLTICYEYTYRICIIKYECTAVSQPRKTRGDNLGSWKITYNAWSHTCTKQATSNQPTNQPVGGGVNGLAFLQLIDILFKNMKKACLLTLSWNQDYGQWSPWVDCIKLEWWGLGVFSSLVTGCYPRNYVLDNSLVCFLKIPMALALIYSKDLTRSNVIWNY